MKTARHRQVNQIFIGEPHPGALQLRGGWIDKVGCIIRPMGGPGILKAQILVFGFQNRWVAEGETQGLLAKRLSRLTGSIKTIGWDLSELFRINSDCLLGQMEVFAYCQGDPCPERKNPGERQGVCAVCLYSRKGHLVLHSEARQLLQSVKCQKRLTHNSHNHPGNLRRSVEWSQKAYI